MPNMNKNSSTQSQRSKKIRGSQNEKPSKHSKKNGAMNNLGATIRDKRMYTNLKIGAI